MHLIVFLRPLGLRLVLTRDELPNIMDFLQSEPTARTAVETK